MGRTEYEMALENLIGPLDRPDYGRCDETGIVLFDSRMQEYVQELKLRTSDSDTLQIVDDWYTLAVSINVLE